MPDNIEMKDFSNNKNSPAAISPSKRTYQKFPFFVGDVPLIKFNLKPKRFFIEKTNAALIFDPLSLNVSTNQFFKDFLHDYEVRESKKRLIEACFSYENLFGNRFNLHENIVLRKPRIIINSLRELCAQYIAREIVINFEGYQNYYDPSKKQDLPAINHIQIIKLPTELIESIYEILYERQIRLNQKLEDFFVETLRSRETTPTESKKLTFID